MADPVADGLVVLFAVVFYGFLCLIYILRGIGRDRAELALAVPFSLQLLPFAILFAVVLVNGAGMLRPVTLLPILAFLAYDLWYRLLSRKKPVHHPEKWPAGLVVYILLMNAGAIGLNWYGYLVSRMHGMALVACYFVMLGCFGFYQGRHARRKKAKAV